MASTLTVDNIVGATSSDKIHIPGHVVQVLHTASSTRFQSNTADTWLDTGVSVSVTPSSTSSKIFVTISASAYFNDDATFPRVYVSVARGSTVVGEASQIYLDGRSFGTIFGQQNIGVSVAHLDSPATTSATEYSIYVKLNPAASSGTVTGWGIEGGHSITAMEIAQ